MAMLANPSMAASRGFPDLYRDDSAGMTSKAGAGALTIRAPPAIAAAFSGFPVVEIRAKDERGDDHDRQRGKISQSSGSEHEPSSMCLAAMVDEFMEEEGKCRNRDASSSSSSKDDPTNLGGEVLDYLKGSIACSSYHERALLSAVAEAVTLVKNKASSELCKDGMNCASGCVKRATLRHLRAAGYNAAICKSRWDHAGGFPGGDYEYMDVLIDKADGKLERSIVDIDFRGQFEIARPTDRYSAILQELPAIFVGSTERLQQIVNLVCDGMKQSLKKRGMPLPPWRKPEYMRAKWFSAYKRTTNEALRPHDTSDAAIRRELFHTAFRGSRWQSRFASEMELQMVDRSGKASPDKASTASSTATGTTTVSEVKQAERKPAEVPPSGFSLLSSRRGRAGDGITAVTTEWRPPAVIKSRKTRPAGVTGLASVLIEAGLSSGQRQRSSAESSRKPCMVAVS